MWTSLERRAVHNHAAEPEPPRPSTRTVELTVDCMRVRARARVCTRKGSSMHFSLPPPSSLPPSSLFSPKTLPPSPSSSPPPPPPSTSCCSTHAAPHVGILGSFLNIAALLDGVSVCSFDVVVRVRVRPTLRPARAFGCP